MSNAANFEDRVLLRLRRQYSQDEAVALISAKLSEKEIEVGMLKSEIEELKFLLEKSKSLLDQTAKIEELKKQIKSHKAGLRKDERVIELKNQLRASSKSRKNMEKTLHIWQSKFFEIERKLKYCKQK